MLFFGLADDPEQFAAKIVELFERPEAAAEMAVRARREVELHWDAAEITRRLAESYAEALIEKRGAEAFARAVTSSSSSPA